MKYDPVANSAALQAQANANRPSTLGAPENARGQLECASDSIASSLDELGCAVDLMEKCLHMVLQPSVPQPAGTAAAPAPGIPISPAVGYLVNQRRRIDSLVMRVNEMRSRLDT